MKKKALFFSKLILVPRWWLHWHQCPTCERLDIDDSVPAEQATALVVEPCKRAAAHHTGEGKERVAADRRDSLDGYVARRKANDGAVS